jgi:hypothetical protein
VALGASAAAVAISDKTAGAAIDDTATTTEIKAKLLNGKGYSLGGVQVAVYEGFVLLAGNTPTPQDRIEAERSHLQCLPVARTSDFESTWVDVTRSSGFTLRKVFYTVPSRLIGHRLRARLYDDRIELFIGGSPLLSVPRGRPGPNGKHGHVVDYRHVIHALRRKPQALLGLVYRDQLFPREAYRQMFEWLRSERTARIACKVSVELLSLAHERACEGQLASVLEQLLSDQQMPDLNALRARFAPDPARLPAIRVHLAPLSSYEALLEAAVAA